jgi:hypothetical protein
MEIRKTFSFHFQLKLYIATKMKFVFYFFVGLGISFTVLAENIFLTKLESVLDYCSAHQEKIDYGTLFGVSIAKQQLLGGTSNKIVEILVRKCDDLESAFLQNLENNPESSEIGNYCLKYFMKAFRF